MPLQYTNRKGDLYTNFKGQTKTGKPKYFVSKKAQSDSGEPIEQLPEGFEIIESPASGVVSIRQIKPTRLLEKERALVSRLVLELTQYRHERTVIDGDCIIVYVPDTDPLIAAENMQRIFGTLARGTADWAARHTRFSAMLRFTLCDEIRREFRSERYCFRGSREGWMPLQHCGPLEKLARKLIPTLGTDDFYELF